MDIQDSSTELTGSSNSKKAKVEINTQNSFETLDYRKPVPDIDVILRSHRDVMSDDISRGSSTEPISDDEEQPLGTWNGIPNGEMVDSKIFKQKFGKYLNEQKEIMDNDTARLDGSISEEGSESLDSYVEYDDHELEDNVIGLDIGNKQYGGFMRTANEVGTEVILEESDEEEKHNIEIRYTNTVNSPLESKDEQNVITTDVWKDPDNISHVDIHLEMDLRKKNAEYMVDIPDFCVKRISNKPENNTFLNEEPHCEDPDKGKKLNIAITLIIPEDNFEDSDVQVTINSKKKNVSKALSDEEDTGVFYETVVQKVQLAQFSERSLTFEEERPQTNVTKDELPHDFSYRFRKMDIPFLGQKRHTSEADIGRDTKDTTQRYDFRYKLPSVELPYFGKKGNAEDDRANESPSKRHDFRYQLPKIEMHLFRNKRPSVESIDHSMNSATMELNQESPNKRYDFRYKLPAIELPVFRKKESSDTDCNGDRVSQIETLNKRYDFRYKLPKVELPLCSSKEKEDDTDGDVTLENPNKRADFRYKLPKVELPSWNSKERSDHDDTDGEITLENPNARYDFRYQLPKIETQLYGSMRKSDEGENEDETEMEVTTENPNHRFDFRYKLPTIELPLCSKKEKSDDEEADEDATLESPERFDFRYQLPKVKIPLCSSKDKSDDDDSEEEVTVEDPNKRFDFGYQLPKIEFPLCNSKENTDSDAAGGDATLENPNKRFDFRYQLPKVDIPLCGSKQTSDEEEEEGDPTIENQNKRFDFRYQLPKVELPLCSDKNKSDQDDIDGEVTLENSNKRYDFRYQLPKMELPICGSKENVDEEVADGDATIENPNKRFDFRYQLPKVDLPLCNSKEKSDDYASDHNMEAESPKKKLEIIYLLPNTESPISSSNKNVEESVPNLNAEECDDLYQEPTKRFDFRYQFPKIEIPFFGDKGDADSTPVNDNEDKYDDINLKSSDEGSKDLSSPKRFDFRYQLPKMELPLFNRKMSDEESVNEGSAKRYDFRFQLPQIESPLFLSKGRSATNGTNSASYYASSPDPRSSDDYLNLKRSPSTYRPMNIKSKSPNLIEELFLNNKIHGYPYNHSDVVSSTDSRYGDELKQPLLIEKINKRPNVTNNEKLLKNPFNDDSSVLSSEEHSDIDLYPSPYRTMNLSSRSLLSRSLSYSAGSSDVDFPLTTKMRVTYQHQSILDQCNSIFNRTQYPTTSPKIHFSDINNSPTTVRSVHGSVNHKFAVDRPTVFIGTHCSSEENCKFSILFEDPTEIRSNKLKVQHNEGLLTVCECFLGHWQQTMTCTALFESSSNDLRMVILPISEKDVVILYNAEVMVEYNLKGSIENLEKLTIEGDIKLSDE